MINYIIASALIAWLVLNFLTLAIWLTEPSSMQYRKVVTHQFIKKHTKHRLLCNLT